MYFHSSTEWENFGIGSIRRRAEDELRAEEVDTGSGNSLDRDSPYQVLSSAVSISRRGVAQPGSAPALGAGGRRFKSSRPDHLQVTHHPVPAFKRI